MEVRHGVDVSTNSSYTSGGAAIVPVNMNLGSSKSLDADVYSGSTTLVLDNTNEKELIQIVIGDSETVNPNGAIILNKNENIAIRGLSKNIGDILKVSLFVFEVKEVI